MLTQTLHSGLAMRSQDLLRRDSLVAEKTVGRLRLTPTLRGGGDTPFRLCGQLPENQLQTPVEAFIPKIRQRDLSLHPILRLRLALRDLRSILPPQPAGSASTDQETRFD